MSQQYLYVICEEVNNSNPVKIGISNHPEKRLKQLQTGHSNTLILFHKEEVAPEMVRGLEKAIHKTLSHHRVRGEWFSISREDAVAEIKHALIRYGDVENLSARLRSKTI